jgi:hypothetical protein
VLERRRYKPQQLAGCRNSNQRLRKCPERSSALHGVILAVISQNDLGLSYCRSKWSVVIVGSAGRTEFRPQSR